MKCPFCELEIKDAFEDKFICIKWACLYLLDNNLPTKEQLEAMQRKEFLPSHGEKNGRKWELTHGHYGWVADYDWPKIATEILKGYVSARWR